MDSEAGERRLTAILSADVVGYSRLMAEDEAATVRTVTAYREEIGLLVRQHRGRVVDAPGDNTLAEFPTATDALTCAVAVQRVIEARNAPLPEDRKMRLRIGIHLGEVTAEGERIYGDGVNIAARLEALAEAGGVCVSAAVRDQVGSKLDLVYEDRGAQALKNIPRPVRVYDVRVAEAVPDRIARGPGHGRAVLAAVAAVVALAAIALWATWPRPLGLAVDLVGLGLAPERLDLPAEPSIVVLPFTNMSGDAEQEYFADGIAEDLTTALSQVPGLFVISRNSAFTYKGRAVKIEEVGRELGVRYALEGSVRRAGDRVRITAQLIDAIAGNHLWSERYDRHLADIFTLQAEISEEILVRVGVEIDAAELDRIRRKPTDDLTAFDTQYRARALLYRMRRAENEEAKRLAMRAIELDPDYAPAQSLLGSAYAVEFAMGWSADPKLLDRAREQAERALALDPLDTGSYATLAMVEIASGRPERALDAAMRAVELAPNSSNAHLMLGVARLLLRQWMAAIQSLNRAGRLDPRTADSAPLKGMTAAVYWELGRRDEAVELWERARADNPDMVITRLFLAEYYAAQGRDDEVRRLAAEIARVNAEFTSADLERIGARSALGPERAAALAKVMRRAGIP